ncbi:MAG TPA: hypothetical protein VK335_02920 [Bryobacteraceae bacterium]|nr:hypothetical protein [Bryobacteraceae bacterium]
MANDGGLGAAGAAGDAGMGANPVGVSDGGCDACAAAAASPPAAPAGLPAGPAPPAVAPAKPKVSPIITVARNEVLVQKPYLPPVTVVRTRVQLTDSDRAGFDGTGTLTVTVARPGGAQVNFFDAPANGNLIVSTGGSANFTAAELNAGVTLHAEGVAPSGALNDITLKLELFAGPTRDVNPPQSVTITSIEVFLEIHQSRTAPTLEPTQIGVPDKVTVGRVVHRQAGNHHGRALVILKQALPTTWPGNLDLNAFDARVRLFDDPNEVAPAGAVIPLTLTIANTAIPPAGRRFWAEGVSHSVNINDTGFKVGISGLSRDGDWVRMTVVEFSNLRAVIPATPAHPNRNAPPITNHPVPSQPYQRTGAGTATHYSENDTDNRALVLIENSIAAGKSVALSVHITPAAVPVRWSIQRDIRGGPGATGDHADVIAANANATPTLSTDSGLTTNMTLDAVGTFHIRPYVDCNGNNTFEHNLPPDAANPAGQRIDREPFIIMNLILIHIEGFDNISRATAANIVINPAAPTTATGIIRLSTNNSANPGGPWPAGTEAQMAAWNNASATVIGGGPVGRNGLNRLFSGWVNNELTVSTSTTVPPGEDAVSQYNDAAAVPPRVHPRVSIWTTVNPGTVFLPTVPPAPAPVQPVIRGGPFLDTSQFGGEGVGGNTCIGTEGVAFGPVKPINKTPLPVGQRWRVEQWDSPGDNAPVAHEGFPGTAANPIPIIRYRFNLNFRTDLVFWTNITSNAGNTGDPADRLYAVVQTNTWRIRIAYRFDPPILAAPGPPPVAAAAGASHRVNQTISMVKDADPHRKAGPAEDPTGPQVRSPLTLNLLAIDSRT